MQSKVDFANISNNRIAFQHIGYKCVPTKYSAFADWEGALNPAGKKNSSGSYTNMEI